MTNPYVIDGPLSDEIYGREDVFDFVREALNASNSASNSFSNSIVVLFGGRRMGKTSVLRQLPRRLPSNFHPVYFDLEGKARLSLDEVLYELARAVVGSLNSSIPEGTTFDSDFFRRRFLPGICRALGQKRLLFLLDEFDVPEKDAEGEGEGNGGPDLALATFFPYLQRLSADEPGLAFVLAVGRRSEELPVNVRSIFPAASFKGLSLLEREEALQLIGRAGIFEEEASERILSLTGGHPYLTQLVCYELYERQANGERSSCPATVAEVEAALDHALERGQEGLTWMWEGWPPAERIVLSAVVHVTSQGQVATEERLREVLWSHGLPRLSLELTSAPGVLVGWGMLESGREEENGYRVPIELLGDWIADRHPLQEVVCHVDLTSGRARRSQAAARRAHLAGDLQGAVESYGRALAANPHYLEARLGLAQALYEQGDLAAAVTEYERACEKAAGTSKAPTILERLLLTRMAYGQQLEREGMIDQAQEQYRRVLAVARNPRHCSNDFSRYYGEAGERLAELLLAQGEEHLAARRFDKALAVFHELLELRPEDDELKARIADITARQEARLSWVRPRWAGFGRRELVGWVILMVGLLAMGGFFYTFSRRAAAVLPTPTHSRAALAPSSSPTATVSQPLTFTPSPSPTPTPTKVATSTPSLTPTSEPMVTIKARTLRVRSGPGTEYDVVARLEEGDRVMVQGKNERGDWLKILLSDDREGWVATEFVEITVGAEAIPVVDTPPPPTKPPESPTPAETPTDTPTSTLTPTPTKTPTATPTPFPTYPAPRLLEPENERHFSGEGARIELRWQPVGSLAEDEWYGVNLWYVHFGEKTSTGAWVKETRWRVPQELAGQADEPDRAYHWEVVVVRQFGANRDGSKKGVAVSSPSLTRTFYWR